MIRLTYLHWNNEKVGTMLLNPNTTIAVTPAERNGRAYSQIIVQGYTFSVAETVEEIDALMRGFITVEPARAISAR